MGIIITTQPPRAKIARDLSWFKVHIRKMQLNGRSLTLIDATTGGKAVCNRGFHSVYLFFYLKCGDRIQVQGYVCTDGHINFSEVGFDEPVPSEAEQSKRADEAQGLADYRWCEITGGW